MTTSRRQGCRWLTLVRFLFQNLQLVMFLDAIEHVSRICRVIRLPLGNSLLLGVGGSGRQSLTRLAVFMEDFELYQIEIAKGYGNNEWRDDLKSVLKKAGIEGRNTAFLFTDTQIIYESFLEDINNILNSGEVPNLLGNEDMEEIGNTIRPILQAEGLPVTKMAIYSTFIKRVRTYLHLVICMSPVGDAFRQRLRMCELGTACISYRCHANADKLPHLSVLQSRPWLTAARSTGSASGPWRRSRQSRTRSITMSLCRPTSTRTCSRAWSSAACSSTSRSSTSPSGTMTSFGATTT